MRTSSLFATSTFTALAATAKSSPNTCYEQNINKSCPVNDVQPAGTLPEGSISTSVLVHISAQNPQKAFAATEWAKITPNDFCTIFNLDLPVAQTQGRICNLVFDFPSSYQVQGLLRYFDGPGHFNFTGYAVGSGAQPGVTTYANQPAPGPSPPTPPPVMTPGHSYIINSAPCGIPAQLPGPVTVSGSLCSSDTALVFEQSTDLCPLGFFVVLSDDANTTEP